MCKDCADEILKKVGGNQHCYIKDIFGEHWDDYQLLSMSKGGNKSVFKIMKEYNIHNESLADVYYDNCLVWYRAMHQARMDKVPFNQPKPGKDIREQLQQKQDEIVELMNKTFDTTSDKITAKSSVLISSFAEKKKETS